MTSLLGHEGEKRYAYYDADGRLLAIQQPDQDLPGPVTVKECTHEGEGVCEYLPVEGEEKHQKHCLACDYLWEEEENCSSFTYAPIENDPGSILSPVRTAAERGRRSMLSPVCTERMAMLRPIGISAIVNANTRS